MKKIFVIWLALGLSFLRVIAQNNLPPAYEIKADTAVNITLNDAYWQMLEDKGGQLTIDQVSKSPLANKFHDNTTKTKSIDYSIHTYWLRHSFRNDMTHEVRIAIPTNATYADFYTPGSNGTWDQLSTGFGVPWSKRDGLKQITTLIYTIAPGKELMLYERYNFDLGITEFGFLEINFGFADKAIQKYYDLIILLSFLLGIVLLAAIFNLYFFLITRQRTYLFFSLTLLFRGIASLLFYTSVFLPEHPILKYYFFEASVSCYFFFLIHFARYFLESFKHLPRWDKFLIALSIFVAFELAIAYMKIIPVDYINFALGVVMLLILATFILFIRSISKSVRWSIVAVLPGIFLLPIPVFYYLLKYMTIPIPELLTWAMNWFDSLEIIGLMWLLIFFSWSLFQRYNQLQKQIAEEKFAKEKLAKEKEIERSQLIAQRTELEMQALRAQMNPHFIFNSLNSIDLFILQNDKTKASKYLTKFSRLIRMILNSSANASVSLADDLQALQLYLELEGLRCEQKFSFEIKCDADIDADYIQIPPMLLQPFAENAIWHGLMNLPELQAGKEERGHLCINITEVDSTLICTVTDDGIGRKKAGELEARSGKPKSMGMKITEGRIAMMQKMNEDKSIEIRDLVDTDGSAAGTEVILRIPVMQHS